MRWSGEFAFGEVWVAFRGGSAENRMHAHAAVQVAASADGVTLVDAGGTEHRGRGWVVRSGMRHRLLPASALTLVLIEPQSRFATGLLQRLSAASIAQLPEDLAELLVSSASMHEAVQTLEKQVLERARPVDPRLLNALAFLDQHSADDAVAAAACPGAAAIRCPVFQAAAVEKGAARVLRNGARLQPRRRRPRGRLRRSSASDANNGGCHRADTAHRASSRGLATGEFFNTALADPRTMRPPWPPSDRT